MIETTTTQTKFPMNASAHEVARLGILSEHAARQMIKRGEMPGFYNGSHFRINVPALVRQLYGTTEV